MKVLSLFDGISCARVAIEKAGFSVDEYYVSEIDKYAMEIAEKNYPDSKWVGSVQNCGKHSIKGEIDLLIGGSPCQDLSVTKKDRKGLNGERSGLFWEYARILKEVKPKYFILENVNSMPKEAKRIITETLGVEPIMINASLVSGQVRRRLFWTNIPNITQPKDKGILLSSILEEGFCPLDKSFPLSATYDKAALTNFFMPTRQRTIVFNSKDEMDYLKERWLNDRENIKNYRKLWRKLNPIECERLQGLPDNYTLGVSNSQRYKMLGNAFNVDVVAHILTFYNIR